MDEVRRAIEDGRFFPNQVARLRRVIRAALVEDGQIEADDAGCGSRRRVA